MRQKTHALTLVLNPNARKPRLKPPNLERLRRTLGPNSKIHLTQDLDALDRLMKSWKSEEETLCFYGGDGSITRGLTAFLNHQGERRPLPPVLCVRAGTINMLCSILGFRESVEKTLARWTRLELDTIRTIPLLKVEVEGMRPHYGFIFSWGVGYRVLHDYYSRRAVPDVADGVAVLAKTFFSSLLPNAGQTRLFRSEDLNLSIDGRPAARQPLHSLLVGTIPRLSLGIRPFAPEPILPGGFHVSANSMHLMRVALHSPTLLYQLGDQRELAKKLGKKLISATGVRELTCELAEGYTMDGEMFELPERARVRITPGPVVRFWVAGNA